MFGLRGGQVMYIAEAIPTVVIGVITFFVLTDRPEQAKFLTAEERNWLVTTIAAVKVYRRTHAWPKPCSIKELSARTSIRPAGVNDAPAWRKTLKAPPGRASEVPAR